MYTSVTGDARAPGAPAVGTPLDNYSKANDTM